MINLKKDQVQNYLKQSNIKQVRQVGMSLGEIIKSDIKITHMPIVRVI